MNRALLVIAKRPQAGQTKTRLTPPLTGEQAASLYECLLCDTLDLARTVPAVSRFVLYTPPAEMDYFEQLAPDFQRLPQQGSGLGARLDNALTFCLTNGFDQVVVMNSDGPTLPADHLTQAFDQLNQVDVVLGPSEDGGYYLIGLTQPRPRLLREVKMSTPVVLQDTLTLAEAEHLTVALLPRWYDVDTGDDLRRLALELRHADNGLARHTEEFLGRWNQ
ncbi:MAG TPA: TIGR04282 family arsenosugar biosynthesis glycosyltransferase [Anaerolineae bacterium]|jgi:hypothetical protein